jgi:hypothetical protein
MPRDRNVQIDMMGHVAMYNNEIQPATPQPVAAPQPVVNQVMAAANGPMVNYALVGVQTQQPIAPQPVQQFVAASQLPPGVVQPSPVLF